MENFIPHDFVPKPITQQDLLSAIESMKNNPPNIIIIGDTPFKKRGIRILKKMDKLYERQKQRKAIKNLIKN